VTGTSGSDDVSDEARMIAAQIRRRAAAAPTADELAALLTRTPSYTELTPGQIRRLAGDAITQAQQISYLLGKLAGLLEDEAGDR
jgi:hypothetical protein